MTARITVFQLLYTIVTVVSTQLYKILQPVNIAVTIVFCRGLCYNNHRTVLHNRKFSGYVVIVRVMCNCQPCGLQCLCTIVSKHFVFVIQ